MPTDFQDIDWSAQQHSRQQFRISRTTNYQSYRNHTFTQDIYSKYDPSLNILGFRKFIPTKIFGAHFQLRNLIHCTSQYDVFYSTDQGVFHYHSLSQSTNHVINSTIKVSTMQAKNNFVCLGGFNSDFIYKRINISQPVETKLKLSLEPDAIINHVDVIDNTAIVSCNDVSIKYLDLETKHVDCFKTEYAVNCTATRNYSTVMAGDCNSCDIFDKNREKIVTLVGHADHIFSCDWKDDHVIATGSQDMSIRLWDIRYPKYSFSCIKSRIGAFRCLKYSPNGRFLAATEQADFMYVFDTNTIENVENKEEMFPFYDMINLPVPIWACSGNDFIDHPEKVLDIDSPIKCQVIDFFGDCAGVCWSIDGDSLYCGNMDEGYGGIMEFSV